MEKHKAIAIPVSFINDKPHFLLVHDRRYSEWTFVTGGCRKREIINPLRCALRELEEETRGVLNLKHGTCSYFKFQIVQKDFDGEFTAIYHVYIIDYQTTSEQQKYIIQRFNEEKQKMDLRLMCFKKQYDENDSLDFDTLDGLKKRHVWSMITTHVLENPEFHSKLQDDRREFSLKY
jgi:ADP-ribose pyrophosphatase YjhB (NUDIX family)